VTLPTARPLDFLDLPALYRLREQAVCLDAARLLTRGNPLNALGFLSFLNPARHIFSAVSGAEEKPLFGGVSQSTGQTFARLLYLTPQEGLNALSLAALLEALSAEAGRWETWHLTAEAEEESPAFEALRQTGFAVYAWQRFWRMPPLTGSSFDAPCWRKGEEIHLPEAQNLFHQLVPPLLHSVEPAPRQSRSLWMCAEPGKGYALQNVGPLGMVLSPLLHPEVAQPEATLRGLLANISNPGGLPLYLCVRSYQAWLEIPLQTLGAEPGPRQAVLVKRLAVPLKETQTARASQSGSAIPASNLHTKP